MKKETKKHDKTEEISVDEEESTIKWNEILQVTLTILSIGTILGYLVAYFITTSYIAEIEFSVPVVETHVLFSIVKNVVLFYLFLFVVIMFGSFLSYNELSKNNDVTVTKKIWWTSSLTILLFHVIYFGGANLFSMSIGWTTIYLLATAIILIIIEYLVVKKISKDKDFIIVFWQMYYSLVVVGFLFLVATHINASFGWGDVVIIIVASLAIHSYPYFFILSNTQSKEKYLLIALVIFTAILFVVSPNALKKVSLKNSQTAGIEYKSIKITDDSCSHLNQYYDDVPCVNNKIEKVTGLWMQGNIHLFEGEKESYEIKREDIIRKIKTDPKKIL